MLACSSHDLIGTSKLACTVRQPAAHASYSYILHVPGQLFRMRCELPTALHRMSTRFQCEWGYLYQQLFG
jgi:hypothetical protein